MSASPCTTSNCDRTVTSQRSQARRRGLGETTTTYREVSWPVLVIIHEKMLALYARMSIGARQRNAEMKAEDVPR